MALGGVGGQWAVQDRVLCQGGRQGSPGCSEPRHVSRRQDPHLDAVLGTEESKATPGLVKGLDVLSPSPGECRRLGWHGSRALGGRGGELGCPEL